MVGAARFEPATTCAQGRCATRLRHAPIGLRLMITRPTIGRGARAPVSWAAMPQAELLIASQNPGKLNEMRLLLEGLPFRVPSPRALGILTAPEETGSTFLENATLKALDYARRSGRLTEADDSGLSVDALDGGPGLYSSRFRGEWASDLDPNRLLPAPLPGVPRERPGSGRWRKAGGGSPRTTWLLT